MSGRFWEHLGASGSIWALLGASGSFWEHLKAFERFLGASGSIWALLGASGSCWRFCFHACVFSVSLTPTPVLRSKVVCFSLCVCYGVAFVSFVIVLYTFSICARRLFVVFCCLWWLTPVQVLWFCSVASLSLLCIL